MVLGAFIDAGLKLSLLAQELRKLPLKGVSVTAHRVKRGHISGTKVDVAAKSAARFAHVDQIYRVIDASGIEQEAKAIARNIYAALAKAEAVVHRQRVERVHFHQLGELDTIIDVVGCALAVRLMGIEKLYSSAVSLGTGMVQCRKERFPLPAPAALLLLKGRTVTMHPQIHHELVTPTGAAILATLTEEVSEFIPMRILTSGYGAGSYTDTILPNLLTLIIGETDAVCAEDQVMIVETNFDDTLALSFEVLFEKLFAAGAFDVYTAPVMMKKMRQGSVLHIVCRPADVDRITSVVFRETTTLGVRMRQVVRRKLERKILNMKTDYGIIVKVKIATLQNDIVTIAPEYEDCKNIARRKSLPFKTVYETIKAQAMKEFT